MAVEAAVRVRLARVAPDAADRVHTAACVDGRVDVLVTRNTGGFSSEQLGHTV